MTVESLAFGGEGVARHEGLVVLVEGALPGERVLARLTRRSRNFARARAEAILSSSPSRIPPRCRHFPECGGCAYQHLEYPAQLEAKRRQIFDLLTRIGRFRDPAVSPPIASPRPFQYRCRMTYALPAGAGEAPGLHRRQDPASIVEVDSCLLPEEALQEAYGRLANGLRKLPAAHRPALVEVQAGEPGERPLVLLRGRGGPPGEILRLAAAWCGAGGPFGGVVWSGEAGDRRRGGGARHRTLAGNGWIRRRLGRFVFRVPAGAFFQANTELAARLFELTAARCGPQGEGILELYCGVGPLTLYLAGTGSRILAVEGNPAALEAAKANCRENDLAGVELKGGSVEKAIRELEASGRRFGAVVADPPRSGLARGTAPLLGRLAVGKILILSCDPATLARDLREIVEGGRWRLERVFPLDLFPQTAEIECLAELAPPA